MAVTTQELAARLQARFGGIINSCTLALGELTLELARADLLATCFALRDEPDFAFEQMVDLCGMDYLDYGAENSAPIARQGSRYAVVYHLLSVTNNQRLRVRVFLEENLPRIDTVTGVWAAANWYEREAFDLFGILFDGHPDLRRLLTDYGFIGHPFRKDFPLIGQVEMRYDPEKRRVVYEPVSIEPRILVPRVIRHDSRYPGEAASTAGAKKNG